MLPKDEVPDRLVRMSTDEIDSYLAGVGEPQRGTLEQLRQTLRQILPDAEEGIAYGAPAFKMGGKAIAGFAAYKDHLSYLPHSGAVTEALGTELAAYKTTKGSVQFAIDEPLPDDVVGLLVAARKKELGPS